jgi:hypothetical protein
MTRIRYALAVALLLQLNASPSGAEDCRHQTTGDICAVGSPWSDFTQFRLQLRGDERSGTTTMTMHGPEDFSVSVEDAPARHGTIIVVAGRAMMMKDVQHERGYEIDALDGPVLMHQLVITLLDQAFPNGPTSVGVSTPVKIAQKRRAIRIATPSAGGRLEAPWTLTGTARSASGRIEYDLQFVFTADGSTSSLGFTGFWEKLPAAPPLDDHMSLDGWTVHWLTPMTSTSEQGTILDYGAKPVSEHWPDLAALRKYIADEPARRAKRRVPADPANPGRPQTFSFEAFEVDRQGVRTLVGKKVLEYRPGSDVVVEQTAYSASSKTLPLGYGLRVSTDVYRERELTGFGLVVGKDDSRCLSWEWFDRENGDVFRKLRGGGKVKVSAIGSASDQELVAIEFLDEIALSCKDDENGLVHEVRVKTGSVFKVKP